MLATGLFTLPIPYSNILKKYIVLQESKPQLIDFRENEEIGVASHFLGKSNSIPPPSALGE